MRRRFLLILVMAALVSGPGVGAAQGLARPGFEEGWRFLSGDDSAAREQGYDDSKWRVVDLPHDWSIEGDFSEKNSTGQQEGGLPAGVGWYRKTFDMPDWGKGLVYIEFDGVYRNSEVWINGHYLGKRPNGYISFRYALTPWLLKGGVNVLAVRVDNSAQPNSRWYTGSGIYRHVRLVTTTLIAIDQWGTFVTTPVVTPQEAKVRVRTVIRNAGDRGSKIDLLTAVVDEEEKVVARKEMSVVLNDTLTTVDQEIVIPRPHLWSPDHPYLYWVGTTPAGPGAGPSMKSVYLTPLGIRQFRFDAEKGLILNGQGVKIRGVCMHSDLGALGAAVSKAAIRRQLKILKEMGCNGIRTAHNPPAPELLDLCDSMGFIVMDEAFDMWRKKKNKYDYSQDFAAWHVRDLQDQVKRDRNHPSVLIWSIGNEIREQFDSSGVAITRELVSIVKSLDSTRPVTSAMTEMDTTKNFIYRADVLDLAGFNYNQDKYHLVPTAYPGLPFLATETTSALETRGHYDLPADAIRRWPPGAKEPLKDGNPDWTVSAYDDVSAYWGSTHEETWKVVKKYPFISGMYIWTGFDYLGEPTPYPWPARSSYFGIVDLAGFPKDVYYMYQSEWTSRPVLHLFPHWNWHAGDSVDVWAYYNRADGVELFLNGRSLGIRRREGEDLHVSWRVAWQPGILKAVSREKGQVVLVDSIRTAGRAAKIRLRGDRKIIHAGGQDLCYVTVRITDAGGELVPDAVNELRVQVEGCGVLAGLDNGYQADLESFRGDHHRAYNGMCLAIIRGGKKAGKIVVRVSGDGLESGMLTLLAN